MMARSLVLTYLIDQSSFAKMVDLHSVKKMANVKAIVLLSRDEEGSDAKEPLREGTDVSS